MRKILLLITGTLLSVGLFAQVTFQQVGSASNPLTAFNSNNHTLATNQALKTVIFVHRNSIQQYGNSTFSGNYRYDFSKNYGSTWTLDHGPINPSASNANPSPRFPECSIYNPAGNTDTSLAYLVFAGSYHDGATNAVWQGLNSGTVKLSNPTSGWHDSLTIINGADYNPSSSLVEGAPGVYWKVGKNTTTAGGSVLIMKGIYNQSTHGVYWSLNNIITPPFDRNTTQSADENGDGSWSIAFDSIGQNGWIASIGDITYTNDPKNDYVNTPIFYRTTDGGATWAGPITFFPTDFPSIKTGYGLPITTATTGDSIYSVTTTFESDLVVDKNGNPHLGTAIGYGVSPGEVAAGTTYSVSAGGLNIFDFMYNTADHKWYCSFIDSLVKLRADTISNNSSQGVFSEDQRIQLTLSSDRSKIIYSWADYRGATVFPNARRNVYVRGFDPINHTLSPEISVTAGTMFDNAGYLHSVSYMALENATNDSILLPMTIAKIRHSNDIDSMAYFYYANGINIANADFTTTTSFDATTLSTANFGLAFNSANCTFNFVDSSINASAWLWNFGGGQPNSSTAQNPTGVGYTSSGNYTVFLCATSPDGMTSYANKNAKATCALGINSLLSNYNLNVFPNPTNSILNIAFNDFTASNVNVSVENMLGQQISNLQNQAVHNGTVMSFDLKNQTAGVYFIKFQTEKGNLTQKFVIEK